MLSLILKGICLGIQLLEASLRKQTLQAVAHGARFSRSGNHARAAAEFEKATVRDPEYDKAHHRLGVEYAQLGRLDEGEMESSRSVGQFPV